MIDTRRLRSFLALAEHGGFRRAAEALGVSQPTLSAHITELETQLRVPLVHRTTRLVRLTPMGQKFLVRARRALDELENATLEIRDEAALQRGRVIVACTRMLASHVVPPVVRQFREKFPAVEVQIIDDVALMVERCVEDGRADFGLAPRPDRTGSLGFQRLITDDFLAAWSKKSPRKRPASVSLVDLLDEPFIAMIPGTSIRRTVDHAFAAAGLSYEPAFEVRNHSTALGMVEAGIGITMLPGSAFPDSPSSEIRCIPVRGEKISRDIGLIHQHGSTLSPSATEFTALLRRTLSARARSQIKSS